MQITSKLLGIFLMVIGGLWLSNILGFTDVSLGLLLTTYWPVLLVVYGLQEMNNRERISFSGAFLILLGLVILSGNLGWHQWNLSQVWRIVFPLILIFIGWEVLRTASNTSGAHWVVMSGLERKKPGWELKNSSFVVLMGGIDLDLSVAQIPPRSELNLQVIMGGIDLRVPADVRIEAQGLIFLGGIDSSSESDGGIFVSRGFTFGPATASKKIKLNYRVVMGGIDIKVS